MLANLERFIDDASQYKEESVHHAITLIGTLSRYLDKNGQKKLIHTFEKMMALLLRPKNKGASEMVNKSICKCVPKLVHYFDEKAKHAFNEMFQILRHGKHEHEIRGAAYGCAGIAKGFGLKFFIERDILGII